ARWRERPGRGFSLPLSGWSDEECETIYAQLGVNLLVLPPGEPNTIYHRETDSEGFLVLAGTPLLLIEGEVRELKQWAYVHSPPGTNHAFVGAGDQPSAILAIGSRQFIGEPDWGMYTVDDVALEHGAGVEEETPDAGIAYARFADDEPTAYRDGWLP